MPANDTARSSAQLSDSLARWDDEGGAIEAVASPALVAEIKGLTLPERQILECLGAAVVTLWNDLPRDFQRTIFSASSADGDSPLARDLRGRLARFLHHHKDDAEPGT